MEKEWIGNCWMAINIDGKKGGENLFKQGGEN
jgi:hypothetical protein